MKPRSVEELMDLLHAARGAHAAADGPADLHEHALQTAALLRRSRPSDKELQVAGLVHGVGRLLRPGAAHPAPYTADAVRPLLGERVSLLVRLQAPAAGAAAEQRGRPGPHARDPYVRDAYADDALTLRQACEAARLSGMNAGVLEDWRTVLEIVAARAGAARREPGTGSPADAYGPGPGAARRRG